MALFDDEIKMSEEDGVSPINSDNKYFFLDFYGIKRYHDYFMSVFAHENLQDVTTLPTYDISEVFNKTPALYKTSYDEHGHTISLIELPPCVFVEESEELLSLMTSSDGTYTFPSTLTYLQYQSYCISEAVLTTNVIYLVPKLISEDTINTTINGTTTTISNANNAYYEYIITSIEYNNSTGLYDIKWEMLGGSEGSSSSGVAFNSLVNVETLDPSESATASISVYSETDDLITYQLSLGIPKGDTIELQVNGTDLQYKNTSDDNWITIYDLSELEGIGIDSIEQTTSSNESSGENVITITLSNGSTSTFSIYNGAKGEDGSTWISGTDLTQDTVSSVTIEEAVIGDYYFNTDTSEIFLLTTDGWSYITTLNGTDGESITITSTEAVYKEDGEGNSYNVGTLVTFSDETTITVYNGTSYYEAYKTALVWEGNGSSNVLFYNEDQTSYTTTFSTEEISKCSIVLWWSSSTSETITVSYYQSDGTFISGESLTLYNSKSMDLNIPDDSSYLVITGASSGCRGQLLYNDDSHNGYYIKITYLDSNGKLVTFVTDNLAGSNGTNGEAGSDGQDGEDGREIELFIDDDKTGIYWRYVGEIDSTLLITLSDLITTVSGDSTNIYTNAITSITYDPEDSIQTAGTAGNTDRYKITYVTGTDDSGTETTDSTYFYVYNGTNGVDGENGTDGQDGTNGTDGQDGVSITNVSVDENNNLTVTLSNNSTISAGTITVVNGTDGQDGTDGVSITDVSVSESNELSVTLSNGSTISAGTIVVTNGVDGENGTNGEDGISITGVSVDENNHLIVTLSDNSEIDAGEITVSGTSSGEGGTDGEDGVSITDVTVDENNNLTVTLSNGSTIDAGTITVTNGTDGEDGVSITDVTVSESNELSVTLSNNSIINAGTITVTNGVDGENGTDGQDGVSITNVSVDENNSLTVTLSNSSTIDAGTITVTNGTDGEDGENGEDGVSITDVSLDENNNLTVTLSNGSTIDAGTITITSSGDSESIEIALVGGETDYGTISAVSETDEETNITTYTITLDEAVGKKSTGTGGEIFNDYTNNVASGQYSGAMGYGATASGSSSFALGNTVSATGEYAIAMGAYSTASGNNSTAIGGAQAVGMYSIAMGISTVANGYFDVAIGNTARTYSSSDEQRKTAIGYYAIASANDSTSIGSGTSASGNGSFAGGYQTKANASGSVALGYEATTSGDYAVALGYSTLANSASQTVIGKYNVADDSDTYAFIIGNGSSDGRSNLFAIGWDGTIYVNDEALNLNFESITYSNGTGLLLSDSNEFSLETVTQTNTTSTASPLHEESFTVIDSITTDEYGRITSVNTKTVTLPSDENTDTTYTNGTGIAISDENVISLESLTQTATTSEETPSHGESFTVIDSITTDEYGRITSINTKTVTLPNIESTQSSEDEMTAITDEEIAEICV